MEVPREIVNTYFSPITDSELEPNRLAIDVWKAAGIMIELSKRVQHRSWDSMLPRTYNTAVDSSEICNCTAWGLYPYNARGLSDSAGNKIEIGAYPFMEFESTNKEAHSQNKEQV